MFYVDVCCCSGTRRQRGVLALMLARPPAGRRLSSLFNSGTLRRQQGGDLAEALVVWGEMRQGRCIVYRATGLCGFPHPKGAPLGLQLWCKFDARAPQTAPGTPRGTVLFDAIITFWYAGHQVHG